MKFFRYHRVVYVSSIVAVFFVTLIVSGSLFVTQPSANAQATSFSSPAPLTGYAWASTNNGTGLGWISLNCSNQSECGSSNYAVVVNPDKTVEGYGWIGGGTDSLGNNIPGGWVQFGNLSGCPGSNCAARIVGTDTNGANATPYTMSGWARALSYSDTEAGGWDGWISLDCANHSGCGTANYKVTIGRDGTFPGSSNGWGSNVLGRVNFDQAAINVPCIAGNQCTSDFAATEYTNMWCETAAPVACSADTVCNPSTAACESLPDVNGSLVFDPSLVRKGQTVRISWQIDPATPVDRCEARGSNGDVITTSPGMTQIIDTNVTTYTLYCVPVGWESEDEVSSAELRAVADVYGT